MSQEFVVHAQLRADQGKGASRRLRRLENLVPAIIYGGQDTAPVCLTVTQKDLAKHLENEAFYSHVLTIQYDGKTENAILKDLQRHPYKPIIMHADFQRVSKDREIHVKVPLHFVNEDACDAVKNHGGQVNHQMNEVEVICLPGDLPEFIEVDMSGVAMEQILHLSDLKLPKGVRVAALQQGADHDLPVVAVHKPKGAKEESEG